MPHSNFKDKSHTLSSGAGKCSRGQTFDYASERDRKLKVRLHHKFCTKPPKDSIEIGAPKARSAEKATTLKEYYNNESEKLIQRVKIAHSLLHPMSTLFHPIIFSLSM